MVTVTADIRTPAAIVTANTSVSLGTDIWIRYVNLRAGRRAAYLLDVEGCLSFQQRFRRQRVEMAVILLVPCRDEKVL